jgi:hypothetical protein
MRDLNELLAKQSLPRISETPGILSYSEYIAAVNRMQYASASPTQNMRPVPPTLSAPHALPVQNMRPMPPAPMQNMRPMPPAPVQNTHLVSDPRRMPSTQPTSYMLPVQNSIPPPVQNTRPVPPPVVLQTNRVPATVFASTVQDIQPTKFTDTVPSMAERIEALIKNASSSPITTDKIATLVKNTSPKASVSVTTEPEIQVKSADSVFIPAPSIDLSRIQGKRGVYFAQDPVLAGTSPVLVDQTSILKVGGKRQRTDWRQEESDLQKQAEAIVESGYDTESNYSSDSDDNSSNYSEADLKKKKVDKVTSVSTSSSYPCPHCTRTFITARSRSVHVGARHKDKIVSQKTMQCQFCMHMCKGERGLSIHRGRVIECKEKHEQNAYQIEQFMREVKASV